MIDALKYPDDFNLAEKCLQGDAAAIQQLVETYRTPLVNYLIHVGATADESRMLVDELWADCLMARPTRPPRLATYAGNASLQAWLKAVVLNRLLRLKRSLRPEPEPEPEPPGPPPDELVEPPLLEIMRKAVTAAFAECDPEDFLLVHLAHTNGLKGRELARMFNWTEAKVSRRLERARRNIEESTMSHVRAQDPWLELKWADFVELCGVASPAVFGIE